MKEEDYILRKVGTENSFRVPEGYFEGLTSDIMNKLPEKEKPAFVSGHVDQSSQCNNSGWHQKDQPGGDSRTKGEIKRIFYRDTEPGGGRGCKESE